MPPVDDVLRLRPPRRSFPSRRGRTALLVANGVPEAFTVRSSLDAFRFQKPLDRNPLRVSGNQDNDLMTVHLWD
jgi:hypothetical protein